MLVLVVSLCGIAIGSTEAAEENRQADTRDRNEGLVFGPKLLYYPLDCRSPRGCRIECFQHGVSVFQATNISQQDELRLVVNSGISDEIVPRWIEIRPFNDQDHQTLVLTPQTICRFDALVIVPRHSP